MSFSYLSAYNRGRRICIRTDKLNDADPPRFQGLLSKVLKIVILIGYSTLVIPPFTVL